MCTSNSYFEKGIIWYSFTFYIVCQCGKSSLVSSFLIDWEVTKTNLLKKIKKNKKNQTKWIFIRSGSFKWLMRKWSLVKTKEFEFHTKFNSLTKTKHDHNQTSTLTSCVSPLPFLTTSLTFSSYLCYMVNVTFLWRKHDRQNILHQIYLASFTHTHRHTHTHAQSCNLTCGDTLVFSYF